MGLRGDDLLFVVLGVVPGAVIGGRIGYVLLHPAFFGADPGRIVDPSVGSLELTLGVVGGALTGAMVAALLDNRPGRWLHLATIPMLVVVGPRQAVDDPRRVRARARRRPATWRPLYLGPGPWGSLGPKIPSIPSQAPRRGRIRRLLIVMVARARVRVRRRADGRSFLRRACRLGGRAARGRHAPGATG